VDKKIYIGSALRTPIGRFGGSLKRFTGGKLAALVLAESWSRTDQSRPVDFVFLGQARQAGNGPNPARQAVIFSGMPETVPAQTMNLACASGLMSVIGAAEKIYSGKAENCFAGGVEVMSMTPYFLTNARWGQRMGNDEVVDGMWKDGFFCPMSEMVMGKTVEKFLVPEGKISRKEQDEFALNSQKKAASAWTYGRFSSELVSIPEEGKSPGLDKDEHPRPETKIGDLARLTPVFDSVNGTITAGNSSGITDGAAILNVSGQREKWSQAELVDYEVVALDPRRMGLGPVAATQNLLKRNKLEISDINGFELNEAFAAQVIACQRTLKIPEDKLNSWGGAIALGHPIGATGARILTTLLSRLSGNSGALGIATLCVSGGHGVAVLVRVL